MRAATLAPLLALLVGCRETPVSAAAPPELEFLVAAGDSTYWVETGSFGVRLRGAPILVTAAGEQWYEIRIVEDGVDYLDAEFVQERLMGIRISAGDSVLLFADDAVPASHLRWIAMHAGEEPIDVEEEAAPEPSSSATDYVEVLDVHGRYVSWGHALDIDVATETGHTHRLRRGVSDLRTGARITLDSLMSPLAARAMALRGAATLDTMLRLIQTAEGDRAERARGTLASFAFDPAAFSVTDEAQAPAVMFHVAGTGSDGEALELVLPPMQLDEGPRDWVSVRRSLPIWSADSLAFRWTVRDGYAVEGLVDSSGTRLELRLVVDSLSRHWQLGSVPRPLHQLLPLDSATRETAEREALRDAFRRAAEDDAMGVRASVPARPHPRVQGAAIRVVGSSSESGRITSMPSRAICAPGKMARASSCSSAVSRE